jgi:hypothetical protein
VMSLMRFAMMARGRFQMMSGLFVVVMFRHWTFP